MNDDATNLDDDTADAEITHGDEHDDAVIAADDTGMISAERQITVFEIEQAAGDV